MNYIFLYPRYFQPDSLAAFFLALAFAAVAFLYQGKSRVTKILLFFAGAGLAYFACSLDDFLHNWDEQYHALVAKNMISDPFHPVLYRAELLAQPYWTAKHIWLHKQPLFLWQMALSLKLFGFNEIALRLPNIIAHGFMGVFVYDMANTFMNQRSSVLASLTFLFLRFPLVYAAGMEATDHNDYMFLFYVTASAWAMFKYNKEATTRYLILCGVFTGCAVLVKWLGGFLVIGVWGLYELIFRRKEIAKPFLAFFVALIVALPWQIYAYLSFPSEYLNELDFVKRHFTETLENHGGKWYYHLEELQHLIADSYVVYFILALSLLYFALNRNIDRFVRFSCIVSVFAVYLFFSVAETKMPAFCIIALPFFILMIVYTITDLSEKIPHNTFTKAARLVVFLLLISMFFDPAYFLKRHTVFYRPNEQNMSSFLYEKQVINYIGKYFSGSKTILINAKGMAVKLMFYENTDATNDIPEKNKIELLKNKGYKIIALKGNLPQYVLNDHEIIKM